MLVLGLQSWQGEKRKGKDDRKKKKQGVRAEILKNDASERETQGKSVFKGNTGS